MNIEQCPAAGCGRLFTVAVIGGGQPGAKERETVDCPHCGIEVRNEVTSASFRTRKATAEEAAIWQSKLGSE